MIMDLIHDHNPYKDYDHGNMKTDLQGWTPEIKNFGSLIDQLKPSLIIEVGTWKGSSAIKMAKHLQKRGMKSEVLCIDTWLGSLEHWKQKDIKTRPWYQYLNLQNGYPSIYYQFIHNVIEMGLQEIIVPFPNTSLIAARFLKCKNVTSKMIFLDGSHDEFDLYHDLISYWDILEEGGILFGDDWSWESVQNAVKRFCKDKNLTYRLDTTWIIEK